MSCINKNDPKFQELLGKYKNPLIAEVKYKQLYPDNHKQVNYEFKAITNIIPNLTRVNQWFKQLGNTDKFWQKLQQDLQIPKKQIELLKNSEGNTIEEKLSSFAANYSYTVEINIAKENKNLNKNTAGVEMFSIGNTIYKSSRLSDEWFKYETIDGKGIKTNITEEEFENAVKNNRNPATQHYSNLTVPGGTNYTENAITIPGVINVISAGGGYHDNEFNESKGDMAGWFRSDVRSETENINTEEYYDSKGNRLSKEDYIKQYGTKTANNVPTKTRRILEVQSFFQKVRDSNYLISNLEHTIEELGPYSPKSMINSNNFLQLLNKDNNWVTFFVKSIIQDSAKKGYEKVLFPRLDTIIQIESSGHFKSYKEAEKYYKNDDWYNLDSQLKEDLAKAKALTEENFNNAKLGKEFIKNINYDLIRNNKNITFKEWKDSNVNNTYELWHSHQPTLLNTAKFYENDVTNILNKTYGKENVKVITDEYGNTWNEVEISHSMLNEIILNSISSSKFLDNDRKLRNKYFSTNSAIKSSEILKQISNSTNVLAPLAKKLLEYVSINDVPITLVNNTEVPNTKFESKGAFYHNTNEIKIAELATYKNGIAEPTILHEILHALSYKELQKNNEKTKVFKDLYNKSVEKLGTYNPETKLGIYANYTMDEFFVGLFTDGTFIKELSKIEPIESKEFNNLFEELMSSLLKLLGITPKTSLYTQAFAVATNILDNSLQSMTEMEKASEGFYNYQQDIPLAFINNTSSKPAIIQNNGTFLNIPEDKKQKIYENYVNLMDRKREGKAINYEMFEKMFNNLQVFNYKDTYIFGEWDVQNNIFKGRLMSSPGIKELYGALDELLNSVNFVASVPSDIGSMLERKGMYKLDVGKEYNFKGEEMVKNLYFSNKELVEKIFKTSPEKVTAEQVKKYDTFFNYWTLIGNLKKLYESKEFNKILPLLKEIGIYDYNAYKLTRKIKQGKITNDDIETVVKEIIKNSSINKVNIDKTDLLNNPKIYEDLDNELNKNLASFLSKFGIKTEMLEDMQSKLNMDSFAHIDILNKILYVNKNNQENYPQQAGKVIAFMMQHNPLIQEVTSKMKRLSMFKGLTNDELLEAMGDLISQELHKKTNTKLPKDLIEAIKNLVRQFFNYLNRIQIARINKNIAFIADNILIQNQSLITQSVYKPGSVGKEVSKISLREALKSDDFGNSIVERMAKYFILTGSITLSEQGTVYRPNENQIHDLDWVSPITRREAIKIFNELYPNNKYIRNIYNDEYQTDTWLIAPEGYRIENLQIDTSKKVFKNGVAVGSTNKIVGYDIVDSNDNIVSSYIPLSDSHTEEIQAKLIDIFTYPNPTEEQTANKEITLDSGTKLRVADWRSTFAAKLEFGRLKDIWDYNRFIPNENIYKEEKTKPKPIKEGVAEVFEQYPELVLIGTAQEYSDYLDTIFPDSKVKDIVYHTTDNEFENFDKSKFKSNKNTGNTEIDGFYFTDNKEPETFYGKNLKTAIINIQNPVIENYVFDIKKTYTKTIDGIITKEDNPTTPDDNVFVVFEPEQIHPLGGEEDMRKFKEHMDFKNNVKDYFNLSEEDSNFVQDISNLNFTC